MSTLTENVQKVVDAHAALKTAIEGKGVTVPAGTKLTGMPALVDQIQTGGGGEDYGYLTFTAQTSTTLKLKQSNGIEPQKLLKSTDAQNWTKWENPSTNAISLQAGESVYIKADEDASYRTGTYDQATYSIRYNYFEVTNSIMCTGDVRSIVKLVAPADYTNWIAYLFNGCTSLVQAPELPVTNLAGACYHSMFNGCTSLQTAPQLPATNLASNCYYNMFNGCTSLQTAPQLPATNLASGCYHSMFNGCTSLQTAPQLPATNLASNCYHSMFEGCTSLVQAPALPAKTMVSNCYISMFNGCTSLVQAPELPATTLYPSCYQSMFEGCTSLVQAPELPVTNLAGACYHSMFEGCTSLKRIKMNASSGNWGQYMFKGCTSLELVDMTGSTGVPTLSNVNNFENTNDTYKIVVPDSLFDKWIAATNWAKIASHIMKQSDWNAAHPDDQL